MVNKLAISELHRGPKNGLMPLAWPNAKSKQCAQDRPEACTRIRYVRVMGLGFLALNSRDLSSPCKFVFELGVVLQSFLCCLAPAFVSCWRVSTTSPQRSQSLLWKSEGMTAAWERCCKLLLIHVEHYLLLSQSKWPTPCPTIIPMLKTS